MARNTPATACPSACGLSPTTFDLSPTHRNNHDGYFTIDGLERLSFAELQSRQGIYPCRAASIHDIQVRRCVLWNDWGRALEIGAETVAGEIHDILFENCDIIHATHIAMDVQNCDRALCRDIVFRDIRVEMDDSPPRPVVLQQEDELYEASDDGYLPTLIALVIIKGYASCDSVRGRIEDIRFEQIEVTAPDVPPSRLHGHDDDHLVQRVAIENLRINGKTVTTPDAGGISVNEFVRVVTMQARSHPLDLL